MSMENSSDTIGNRTRDLPFCSTVPQLTVPPELRAVHPLSGRWKCGNGKRIFFSAKYPDRNWWPNKPQTKFVRKIVSLPKTSEISI
jgi:hypothetical protein